VFVGFVGFIGSIEFIAFIRFIGLTRQTQETQVEPHGLKPVAPPHASSGGTLRSTPYYALLELRRVPSSHSSTV
jgi:hypothetical protein